MRNTPQTEWLKLGFEALAKGDLKQAEKFCKQIVQSNPNHPQGHFLIGLIAAEMNQRRIAANAFLHVTKLDLNHAGAWAHLAKIFSQLGYTVKADEAISKAAALNPEQAFIQNIIGSVFTMIGEHESATHWYEKASQNVTDNPKYKTNLANSYNFIGQREQARQTINEVLGLDPNNPQAHWIRASLNRQTSDETAHIMIEMAEELSGNDHARSFLYYGAGKVFEDTENWAAAYSAFENGARAKRKMVEFDEDNEEKVFQSLHRLIDKNWEFRSETAGTKSNGPIFIVGQPRTGTTLIERILTAHSKVTSAGELQQFYLCLRRLSDTKIPMRVSSDLIRSAIDIDPEKLGKAYAHATRAHASPDGYFVDKMPTNYLYVPLIARAMPHAKIIHVTRNPMDSCFSSFKQLFADAYPHSYDLEEMARHHVRYRNLMTHWGDVVGDRMLRISYEDTVTDLEMSARKMINFLELDWEPECLTFHTQSGSVSTASASQVREPAHTRSVGRWKHYETQLEPVRKILSEANLLS